MKKYEIEELKGYLIDYYKTSEEFINFLFKNFEFYINNEGKIYIFPYKVSNINFSRLGLYIIKKEKNGYRFSVEGAQLFSNYINDKILEINKEKIFNIKENMKNITIDKENGYYVLKDNKDFLGSGYIKNKVLKDLIPNNRKIIKLSSEKPDN